MYLTTRAALPKLEFREGLPMELLFADDLVPIIPILYGVPQGSVLGPVIFILYVAGVINIASSHGFNAHSYADDLQIYDHSQQSSCTSLVVRMSTCIVEINEWMASNRLKLNPTKTELIWLGSPQRLKHCPVGELQIAGVGIKPTTHVRDLGVMIDNDLSLQCHVNHITRTCFYPPASTTCHPPFAHRWHSSFSCACTGTQSTWLL